MCTFGWSLSSTTDHWSTGNGEGVMKNDCRYHQFYLILKFKNTAKYILKSRLTILNFFILVCFAKLFLPISNIAFFSKILVKWDSFFFNSTSVFTLFFSNTATLGTEPQSTHFVEFKCYPWEYSKLFICIFFPPSDVVAAKLLSFLPRQIQINCAVQKSRLSFFFLLCSV